MSRAMRKCGDSGFLQDFNTIYVPGGVGCLRRWFAVRGIGITTCVLDPIKSPDSRQDPKIGDEWMYQDSEKQANL